MNIFASIAMEPETVVAIVLTLVAGLILFRSAGWVLGLVVKHWLITLVTIAILGAAAVWIRKGLAPA